MMTTPPTDNRSAADPDGPDPDFTTLSADASRAAVERTLAAGMSVSYLENGRLCRRFPDGRVLVVSEEECQALRGGLPWP